MPSSSLPRWPQAESEPRSPVPRRPQAVSEPRSPLPRWPKDDSEPVASPQRRPQADSASCCHKCSLSINGSAITAKDKSYHRECFTCDTCLKPVVGSYFLDELGSLQCEPCHEHSKPMCAGCGRKVNGKSVTIDECTYHRECFTCCCCRRSIDGSYRLSPEDAGFLCNTCHASRAPCCGGCGKKVLDKSVSASGKTYHRSCFSCSVCHNHISGSFFIDKNTTGGGEDLLCEHCHEVKNPPKSCAGCHCLIIGASVGVGKETYHKQCFVCGDCKQPIDGRYFGVGGAYVCSGCQPRCEVCKEPLEGSRILEVNGKEIHQECFKCCTCNTAIKGSHYEADWGLHRCSTCQVASLQAEEDGKESQSRTLQRRLIRRNTEDFKLCWRPELEPCSLRALQAMGVPRSQLPRGKFVALFFDQKTGYVGTAPLGTRCDPRAAVNLSYLASALQVLRRHGREPCFSLDAKDPHDLSGESLVKCFYPSWLASTVFGEVLFQADYALKEICFGEHTKALPFLQNSFDEVNNEFDKEARCTRQWFTLRRTMVVVTADGAVVPKVEMGVETRRLVKSENGYEDAPYTSPDDPMVKQSALVSKHFNKVAGHLPVVGELLALARAMVAAKFLLEHGCLCDTTVLERYKAPLTPEGPSYPLEIPTLTKERGTATVVHNDKGLVVMKQRRWMHGGVDLSVPSKKVPTKSDPTRLLGPSERPTALPLFIQPAAAAAA